jgi:hypothetical protein
LAPLESVLEQYSRQQSAILPILVKAQELYGSLSAGILDKVAQHLKISPSEVYGIATFYPQFRFSPALALPELNDATGYRCHEEDRLGWIPHRGSKRIEHTPRSSDPAELSLGDGHGIPEPEPLALPELSRAIA